MSDCYIEVDGVPVVAPDLTTWARSLKSNQMVGLDTIDDQVVSTIFLTVDHSFGVGPPLLYETMIFGGEHDLFCARYSTRDEAAAGHQRVSDALRRGESP